METLKKNYEFRRLYSKGSSAAMKSLVVYCRKCRGDSRVGFTVSNKIGKAVVRNRIRRRFREIVRLHEQELQEHIELVIVARHRAAFAEYRHLEKDFLTACAELGILREEGASS